MIYSLGLGLCEVHFFVISCGVVLVVGGWVIGWFKGIYSQPQSPLG